MTFIFVILFNFGPLKAYNEIFPLSLLLSIFGASVITGSETLGVGLLILSAPQNGMSDYNTGILDSEVSGRVKYSLRKASDPNCMPGDITVPGKVKAGPKGSVSTLGAKMSTYRLISDFPVD